MDVAAEQIHALEDPCRLMNGEGGWIFFMSGYVTSKA